jgi:hypothetical protein
MHAEGFTKQIEPQTSRRKLNLLNAAGVRPVKIGYQNNIN